MAAPHLHPELFIRLYLSRDAMLGPGKAQLLELIDRTGSISAAGRDMGMSYKRAWMLVETMNGMFRDPVVDSARGGPGGGGAALTDTGRRVLALYRQIEADSATVTASARDALRAMIRAGEEETTPRSTGEGPRDDGAAEDGQAAPRSA